MEGQPVSEQTPSKRPGVEKGDVLAGAVAAAGVLHVLVDVPPEEPTAGTKPERPDWAYSPVGEIVRETRFQDERSTGGIQNAFVELFETVFSAPEGTFYYYDTRGNVLLHAELSAPLRLLKESIRKEEASIEPPNKVSAADRKAVLVRIAGLKKNLQGGMQVWHNENRKKIPGESVTPADYASVGYPFVAGPQLPRTEVGAEATTLIEVVMERLRETTRSTGSGPSYFSGETRTVYDGIVEIAKAYDIPRAIVLGIAANESGYDRIAESDAGARGIFQFTDGGFEDAKKYVARHPELGASIRAGSIGTYEESWKNRFVSAELFCAFYRVIRERTRAKVSELEERLRSLDPGFQTGAFVEIASINAYNAGPGRIVDCIDRFLSLSDEQIRAHVGEPPYGIDAWLGVTALSFGLTTKDGSARVGPDVFLYPQKVLAMGALIMKEENYMSAHDRARESDDEAWDVPAPTRRGLWKGLSALTGIGAVLGGLVSGASTTKDVRSREPGQGVSRRDVLRGAAATVGLASPALHAGKEWLETVELPELPVEPDVPRQVETFAEVEADAKITLDKLNETLLQNAKEGKTGWTADELDVLKAFGAPQNRRMLGRKLQDMLGTDLLTRFEKSEKKPYKQRKRLYDEAIARQKAYVERETRAGNLVALSPDDPANPFFCEQVGRSSGTGNDPEALYIRKEFIPTIGTLLSLVNHQIDAFNAHPELYGVVDPEFPVIPRLSALKISGALRFVEGTKKMFEQGLGGRTTPGASVHWLGNALDIGSFATEGGHMARLDGDLKESKNGAVIIRRGGKLPNQGFGKRTREILSMMIGRALFAMREPVKKHHGIEIQPLWESNQLNWHIALETVETKP